LSVSSDIRDQVDRDAGLLVSAIRRGDIRAGDKVLIEYLTDAEVELLVLRILRFAMTEKLLSVYIHALSSMKWLTMAEACMYSRKSPNTLKAWADDSRIYGTPAGESGSWIFDRESIDSFFNGPRDERRLELERRRKP